MLDLQKLMGQMQGMSDQLQKESQQLTVKLDRAETLFHEAIVNQSLLTQKHEQYGDRFLFNCAEPIESLTKIQAIATSGHTDSHMSFLVDGTHLLTGDALLIRGCGRTDFQSGDAGTLYDHVTQRLFTLPDATLVYPGHDYRGNLVSTIGEEKQWNPRFVGRDRAQFIEFMGSLNLPNPKKIAEAVPANERCGKSPVAA